ncbi:MAG TPA: hypothetical protein H9755_01280 [Candidatus Dietzia intestinigallinarum]|nr:hypothetical protein [Candidatus Dietzia intestinigallinarum]
MQGSSSASVEHVSTPAPHPRPGPTGPDIDELRVAFDDLLADSAATDANGDHDGAASVRDEQVAALDAAHELLADALTALDAQR